MSALLRGILGIGPVPGSLVLQVTAEAATLLGLGAADTLATVLATVALEDVVDAATAAVDMVLDFLRTAPFEVAAAFVMGTFEDLAEVVEQLRARSPLRAELLDHPEFAIASGAAVAPVMAALASPDATAMAPAVGPGGDATTIAPTVGLAESQAEEPQLAYSMTDDGEPLPVEGEFGPDFQSVLRRRGSPDHGSAAQRPVLADQQRCRRIRGDRVRLAGRRGGGHGPADRGREARGGTPKTPPRESSCRYCRPNSRLRYRRRRPMSQMRDTRAASFRTPTATFRRS